jgi:hypothetical protein
LRNIFTHVINTSKTAQVWLPSKPSFSQGRTIPWNTIDDLLRNGLAPFLSNKGLRQRFQSQLPAGKKAKFNNFNKVHIDWKWEFLEKFLDKLEPLMDDLFDQPLSQINYF